jgi:DUF4097 and DUF4098 domain-containing protein YvlB
MPTFETPEPITATIDVPVGDVRLVAGDRATTTIDVVPSDEANAEDVKVAQQTRVEFADGQLLVRAPRTRSWLSRTPGGSVAVTVELPAGSEVRGTGAMTDYHADGALGRCQLKTAMGHVRLGRVKGLALKLGLGDVSVDRVSGHAEVTTASGEVRLSELESSAVVKNSNGATWIGVAGGDLRVQAANGAITVDEAHATVIAKSANGDVRVGDAVRGTVVLETHLGHLEVGIREGTSAYLDVRASAGRVYNSLEAADGPEPSAETVELRARTGAGDVVIRRP